MEAARILRSADRAVALGTTSITQAAADLKAAEAGATAAVATAAAAPSAAVMAPRADPTCHTAAHTGYSGDRAVVWGLGKPGFHLNTSAECCDACKVLRSCRRRLPADHPLPYNPQSRHCPRRRSMFRLVADSMQRPILPHLPRLPRQPNANDARCVALPASQTCNDTRSHSPARRRPARCESHRSAVPTVGRQSRAPAHGAQRATLAACTLGR